MSDLNASMHMDIGLEQISFQEPASASQGVSSSAVNASSAHGRLQLQLRKVLFEPMCHEQQLLASLRPELDHQEVLQPQVFHSLIGDTLESLQDRMGNREVGDRQTRRKFRGAVSTLQKLRDLTGLLRTNQHALHRG
ncbi:type III secretion apparatus assembly protein SctX [Roseiconus lacunae]|uniref:type III secretion apparatus assembly protein SctX n=1 Tax=Roseiconus lacunae TaxID=2605694 RepID=UPI001E487095|nr:hypothetical protein [Roseiconus lacunae]MCD0457866.1 hypothetical protein [Roseiconus lacunae]